MLSSYDLRDAEAGGLIAEDVLREIFEHAPRDMPFTEMARPDSADRKSTRLNSSHVRNSYAVFCLKKKIRSTWSRRRTPAQRNPQGVVHDRRAGHRPAGGAHRHLRRSGIRRRALPGHLFLAVRRAL